MMIASTLSSWAAGAARRRRRRGGRGHGLRPRAAGAGGHSAELDYNGPELAHARSGARLSGRVERPEGVITPRARG